MHTVRRFFLFMVLLATLFIEVRCQQAPAKEQLSIDAFQTKLQQSPDGQLVDVRTAEEYKKNHLKGALNLNVNSKDFQRQVSSLDKSKPVLVYCLSGGRSAKAAAYMREQGFKEVYEMSGGMMQWTAQNKPFEEGQKSLAGISVEDFNTKVNTDKIVLVDFYAKWCAPCKKMGPWLDELSTKYADKVTLLKINVDENATLVSTMKVDVLPTLLIYKNGKKVWSKTGLAEKEELEKYIKANL